MPKRKPLKSKWYRQPSLSSRPDPYFAAQFNAQRALAYKALMLGRELPHAGTYHDSEALKRWQQWIADQAGAAELDARIEQQRDSLWRRAHTACERAGDLLAFYGFGAYVYPSQTWHSEPEEKLCANCDGAGKFQDNDETCCLCEGKGSYLGERIVTKPCLARAYQYYTDGQRFVYIGTRRACGYIVRERQTIQIIISEGRDPDDSELTAMIEAALAEQLELAAK